MMVLLIILAVIVLIALLRFGVALRYNEEGVVVWLRIGFLSFKLHPAKKKRVKKKKMDMRAFAELKPKSTNELKLLISDLKSRLSRIKRRILIKRLDIEYTAAGSDPANTAITFGRANALAGVVLKVLQDNFKIKRCNCCILADFGADRQKIKLDIVVTTAVWEAIYVFFTIIPLFMRSVGATKTSNTEMNRKEIKQNG